jgi:hypothetical protein
MNALILKRFVAGRERELLISTAMAVKIWNSLCAAP